MYYAVWRIEKRDLLKFMLIITSSPDERKIF